MTFSTMAIIGAATFLPDQERSHFRFFAERPVRPRMVWLNRQIVWFPLVLIYLVVGVTVWVLAVVGSVYPLLERFTQPNFHVWVCADQLLGRAVCDAQNLRNPGSGDLSLLVRAALLDAVSRWHRRWIFVAGTCRHRHRLVWLDGCDVGQLANVCRIAGRSSAVGDLAPAPHWIAERSGWWPLTRLALSLVVPLAAIGASTIAFRVLQIPLVDPGVSLAHYASEVTPEASETAQMYRRAEGLIRMSAYPDRGSKSMTGRADHLAAQLAGVLPRYGGAAIYGAPIDSDTRKEWDERRAIAHDLKMLPWLAENQEPFRLALAATERPSCVFPLEPRGVYLWYL